jgi:integrase
MKRDGVFQREDCKGWYVSYVDAQGKRRKQRVEAHTRTQALEALSQIKMKEQRDFLLGVKEQSDISTEDLFNRYLEHQGQRLKPTTLERVTAIVKTLKASLPALSREISRSTVERYITSRLEDVSASTLTKEITTLKHCLRLAVEWELLNRNVAQGVKLPKLSQGKTRYLSPAELKAALTAAPEWLRAPMALAAFTGCRRGELLSLKWADVDLEKRRLYLHETKNGELRVLVLNDLAAQVLESLPRTDALVMPGVNPKNLSVETRRIFKRLGIVDASFHTLRHTAASWLAMNGTDLYVIGGILGHKTPRMTLRYAHLSPQYTGKAIARLDTAFKGVLPEAGGD